MRRHCQRAAAPQKILPGAILKSCPLKLLFQIPQAQPQSRRPAVRAVAAAIDQMAALQQRFDLDRGQRITGFDGGFTCHHVEDFVQ